MLRPSTLEINWSSRHAKGLQAAVVPVGGTAGNTVGVVWEPIAKAFIPVGTGGTSELRDGPYGPFIYSTSSTRCRCENYNRWGELNQFISGLAVVRIEDMSATAQIFGFWANGSFKYTSTGALQFVDRCGGTWETAAGVVQTGEWYVIGGVFRHGSSALEDHEIWVNGRSYPLTQTASGVCQNTPLPLRVADDSNVSWSLVMAWMGVKPDFAALSVDPWAPFRPRKRVVAIVPNVTVSPPAIGLVEGADFSSVVLGSLSISPSGAGYLQAVSGPGVILGSLTLSPSGAGELEGVEEPTVVAGDISLTPAAAGGLEGVEGPQVVEGSITLSPKEGSQVLDVTGPTVQLGAVTVEPTSAGEIQGASLGSLSTGGGAVVNPGAVGFLLKVGAASFLGDFLEISPSEVGLKLGVGGKVQIANPVLVLTERAGATFGAGGASLPAPLPPLVLREVSASFHGFLGGVELGSTTGGGEAGIFFGSSGSVVLSDTVFSPDPAFEAGVELGTSVRYVLEQSGGRVHSNPGAGEVVGAGIGGIWPPGLDWLSDVDTSAAASGDFLTYDGGSWVGG